MNKKNKAFNAAYTDFQKYIFNLVSVSNFIGSG